MSRRGFEEAIRLEDQAIPNPEFGIVSENVSALLTKINKLLFSLEQDLELERDAEYETLLNTINTLIVNFKQLNQTKNELMSFEHDDLSDTEIFAKDKLMFEINKSLKDFNRLQSSVTELEKKANSDKQAILSNRASNLIEMEEGERRTSATEAIDGSEQQLQQQFEIEYDPINAEEVEYQQNLINERNLEIENISSSILEINEIYQDLNTMVQEQGFTIDNIENNMYSVVNNTRYARNELVKANNYQKRTNGRCLWLLIILSVLFLLMVLVIVA